MVVTTGLLPTFYVRRALRSTRSCCKGARSLDRQQWIAGAASDLDDEKKKNPMIYLDARKDFAAVFRSRFYLKKSNMFRIKAESASANRNGGSSATRTGLETPSG